MKELKIENQWIWKQQQQEQILIKISINNNHWNKKLQNITSLQYCQPLVYFDNSEFTMY